MLPEIRDALLGKVIKHIPAKLVGYSAYTFPLAISSVATLKLAGYLTNSGNSWASYVELFGIIELFIAALIVFLMCFSIFFQFELLL